MGRMEDPFVPTLVDNATSSSASAATAAFAVTGRLQGFDLDENPLITGLPPAPENSHDRVEISAEREVVLSCGEASVTLTRAGKVIIKGNYVVSRSKGVNKIKGAAVDIN